MKTITMTQFRAQPGDFIWEVYKLRHSFLLTKQGKPVARLMPTEDRSPNETCLQDRILATTAPAPAVALTKPQLRELRRLAAEPQPTYGKDRVRVQNNLVRVGLARYLDAHGKEITGNAWDHYECTDACEITDDGRAALKEQGKH